MSGHSQSSEFKFIVTGGPTREWIDPVRFISNPSTGKMGIALAMAANDIARETVFIHGPIHKAELQNLSCRCIEVETVDQMSEAVFSELEPRSVLIMAAAPADYTPAQKTPFKIKKGADSITLEFVKAQDILGAIADYRSSDRSREPLYIVGFAAETNDHEKYALDKLERKKLDMICVNDLTAEGAGFAVDTNIITVFEKNGTKTRLPKMQKTEVAGAIIERILIAIGDIDCSQYRNLG
jgi:phosphopantothenoylcysteine decarboxylase/phosphopantothenate--cysteine ligase